MGSLGAFMFHLIGITVLVFLAITIATISVPRRPRGTDRRRAPGRTGTRPGADTDSDSGTFSFIGSGE